MALLSLILVTTVLAIITITKLIEAKRTKRPTLGAKLPGPKGLPFIGNVLDLPTKCPWMKFHEWSLEYGPIYQVNLAGTNHVWISRDAIAHDLLAKRAAKYSDRPFIPALERDNRDSGQYLPLMSRNAMWSRQRRFAKQIMAKSERESYYSYPELEAVRLLMELMTEPEQYNHAMESFVARVTSRLAWGTSAPAEELKQRARELLIAVSPTGALGNKLPAVMSLPERLSKAKAWELRRGRTEEKFFETMQEEVRMSLSSMTNKIRPSWTSMFLENNQSWGFADRTEGAFAVGMHGIAGALTIAAPMQSFCLAMCHFPQYQPILHEEIDRVLGDRMPTFQDMPDMPVLRAFIRETLRWRPPVPTGIPHELTEDDEYEGYHIPKGSVVHPLEWSISRDPEVFYDPDAWNPLRWLEPEYPTYREPLTKFPTITQYSQFGYGRRTCTGMGVAEADLFVGIGSCAWLFSIHKEGEDERDEGKAAASHGVPAQQQRQDARRDSGVSTASSDASESATASTGASITTHGNDSGVSVSDHHSFAKADCSSVHANDSAISVFGDDSRPQSSRTDGSPAQEEDAEADQSKGTQTPELPGTWNFPREWATEEQQKNQASSYESDPTMRFSSLLIAKPLPFQFQLRVRNQARARKVTQQWVERKIEGEFENSRTYWKGGNEGDKDFGWGEVFV